MPEKVISSAFRYNNCGSLAAAAGSLERQKMVRNPSDPTQYAVSSSSNSRRNLVFKNGRGNNGVEGSSELQPKPQYMAKKEAATQGGSRSHLH